MEILLPSHVWYVADIDAFSEIPNRLGLNSSFLKEINGDTRLMQICSQIDQFLSGVFIAVDAEFSVKDINVLEVGTEDEKFRALPINGVLLEIRAFDTSFFVIYSEKENIIKDLANKFKVEILKSPSYSEKI